MTGQEAAALVKAFNDAGGWVGLPVCLSVLCCALRCGVLCAALPCPVSWPSPMRLGRLVPPAPPLQQCMKLPPTSPCMPQRFLPSSMQQATSPARLPPPCSLARSAHRLTPPSSSFATFSRHHRRGAHQNGWGLPRRRSPLHQRGRQWVVHRAWHDVRQQHAGSFAQAVVSVRAAWGRQAAGKRGMGWAHRLVWSSGSCQRNAIRGASFATRPCRLFVNFVCN